MNPEKQNPSVTPDNLSPPSVVQPQNNPASETTSSGPDSSGFKTDFKWLMLSALAMGVLFFCLTFLLTNFNLLQCDEGLDSLGCILVDAYLSIAAAFALAITGGWLVLRFGRVNKSVWISLSTAFLSAPFYYVLESVQNKIYVPVAVLWLVVFVLNISLSYVVFNSLGKSLRLSIPTVILGVVLLFKILPGIADKIDYSSFQSGQKSAIQNLDFSIYLPDYIPQGYRFFSGAVIDYLDTSYPSFKASYLYGKNDLGDPAPYNMSVFKAPAYFNPPQNCGEEKPRKVPKYTYPCQVLGVTDQGDTVYYNQDRATTDLVAYEKIGNSVITLSTPFNGRAVKKGDVLKIYSSLKVVNAEQIRKLQEEVRKQN